MRNFYLFVMLLFIAAGQSQNATEKRFSQIPSAYLSHPELGRTTHPVAMNEVDYELVQERTKFSRTFLNKNTTRTTLQSSSPLHYRGDDGFWHTIDYKLASVGDIIIFPAQDPYFESKAQSTSITVGDKQINIIGQTNIVFVSNGNSTKMVSNPKPASIANDSQLVFTDILPNVDKRFTLYHGAMKLDYKINSANVLPQQLDIMIVEETIELPAGFTINEQKQDDQTTDRLIVNNAKGEQMLTFEQPMLSDSRPVNESRPVHNSFEGKYLLIPAGGNKYKIQIVIDGSWLQSPQRVYPVTIDPVVSLGSNNVVNSCYFPTYQQSSMQVAVPAGETVLTSDISYHFVAAAGSGAWIADQRSFVSGPNGQTPVASGSGSFDGAYTYNITGSAIGNVVSPGQINFTFNFARDYGGSGCNSTYNFVDQRQIYVTYGTIEFGDGPLVINEYSASNRNFNDGFGRTEDWIELYNSSPDSYFNLAGYYLSNNSNNPTKWQIQSGVIPPNSRVLVFCSERDISSGTVLHASFDLTQLKPDEVVLADPDGVIVESHEMFVTQMNHSYGRTTDGAATWSVFTSPTPGTANTGGFTTYATKPSFNLAPGRYSGTVTVSLSTTGQNEQIRYTTNGSTPTVTSPLYSAPIQITQSTVVRARAFSTLPDILPGFIETNTYFINETSSLPVFSFAGDPDLLQLFNGSAGQLPVGSFEFFENDGTFVEESVGDFNKHGNDSWSYNQRGVDFVTRDDYGYNRRWDHKFFSTTDRTQFRWLMVKPAGSDNYPGQTGGAHMRDAFAHTLSQSAHLDLDERSCTFISLFVNGQYWGLYDLRERVDDNNYTDYYYGQDYTYRDSDIYLQYLKTWGSTENRFGNQAATDDWQALVDFVQNNDMSLEANYNYVDSQLNIDSLIDYFVFNSYLVNHDWLNWNTSWWRGLDPTGGAQKWRYALWDIDGILGHYINYTGIPDISADAPPCQAENIPVGVGHTQTIGKLIEENPMVRQRYITRYADLLNTGLSCEHVTQVFDSIVSVIAPEMPRHILRWGGNLQTWQANVQAARTFLLQRCSQTISTGLVDCYNVTGPFATTFEVEPAGTGKIKMNSEWLTAYPYTAQVFGNIDTLLKAEANPGYEFSYWEVDGAVISPSATDLDIMLQISQATSVTAHFVEAINNGDHVVYYWHFNSLLTPSDVVSIAPDYSQIPTAQPLMTYTGTGPRDIDANSTGSVLNLYLNEPSGKCARVRNPSDNRSLVFDLPTTGYKDIKFGYAVQRTAQGQLINNLSYSLDGSNFIQTGLGQTAFNVGTDFTMIDLDFTTITGANDNANFKVMVMFEGNTATDNGNNRLDNISLKGTEISLSAPVHHLTSYQVFPNPSTGSFHIITAEKMKDLAVYDMLGKKIWNKAVNSTSEAIDLSSLANGIYMLKIKTDDGMITHKIIKQ